jgi:hypothetical protein
VQFTIYSLKKVFVNAADAFLYIMVLTEDEGRSEVNASYLFPWKLQ